MARKGSVPQQQYSLVVYNKADLNSLLFYDVKRYAYILHDKDVNEDGTPAMPHYHLFVSFERPRRKQWLDTYKFLHNPVENILCEPCKELDALLLYFCHFNEKEKYQYPRADIVANFPLSKAEESAHKRYDTLQTLKAIVEDKADWLTLYENDPDLLFSACALDRATEQIATAIQTRKWKAEKAEHLKTLDALKAYNEANPPPKQEQLTEEQIFGNKKA